MNNPFEKLSEKINKSDLKIHNIFSEENIQKLFGHEAAEDESVERLKEYYFKNDIYEQVAADLKLRILVGHKGIGKSALFKVAASEDEDRGILPVSIKPNDVLTIATGQTDFLHEIRAWQEGLKAIIADKVMKTFVQEEVEKGGISLSPSKSIVGSLVEILRKTKISIGLDAVYNNFLKNRKINVYIDDLDRGWEGHKNDIRRISALLNAVRDISNDDEGVHFKISLRSDVYFLVRTSDESTDKIEGSVVWYTWINHEILALLAKRVVTFFRGSISEDRLMGMHQSKIAEYLKPVISQSFEGVGKWKDVPIYRILMSLTRKRPRDLVKLCSLAARSARKRKSQIIETVDFQNIFEAYSLERIQDLENEFRSELPDIKRLVFSMKPSVKKARKYSESYVYDTEKVLAKIKNSMSPNQYYFSFSKDKPADENELLHFLYKINFLQARRENKDGIPVRKDFETNKYVTSRHVDFGFDWEVHPAYRWALEPDDPLAIYDRLEIINEE